jgi:2-dehydro-3-deoxygalactonokinase
MSTTALLAIDWGTTSARVYRLDAAGRLLDQRSAPLGISQVQERRYAEALAKLLGDWSCLSVPRLACGMIGSRQGWIEAPYIDCAASLDRLAAGLTRTPGGELIVVPGLITRDGRGIPDLMRGEETQLLGSLTPGDATRLIVLPGTHSKWALVRGDTVLDFATYLTGELYSVLLAHSLLGRLPMVDPASDNSAGDSSSSDEAFERGLQHARCCGPLTHDLFAARTLALTGELQPHEVAAWLSGLLIGREVHDALAWARSHVAGDPVSIVGEPALAARYAQALAGAGAAAQQDPPHAAARGLALIARQVGLLG